MIQLKKAGIENAEELFLLHFYEKPGHRRTGEEKEIKEGMTLVFYEKN